MNVKKILLVVLLAASLGALADDSKYKEVKSKDLMLHAEEFKNDYICVEAVFKNFMPTLPHWMRGTGMSTEKYYWFRCSTWSLPVIAKKRDLDKDKVMALKRGKQIKIYGKIKKFSGVSRKYKERMVYYIALDKFEVIDKSKKQKDTEEKTD